MGGHEIFIRTVEVILDEFPYFRLALALHGSIQIGRGFYDGHATVTGHEIVVNVGPEEITHSQGFPCVRRCLAFGRITRCGRLQ